MLVSNLKAVHRLSAHREVPVSGPYHTNLNSETARLVPSILKTLGSIIDWFIYEYVYLLFIIAISLSLYDTFLPNELDRSFDVMPYKVS